MSPPSAFPPGPGLPALVLIAALGVLAPPGHAAGAARLDDPVRPTRQALALRLDPSEARYQGSARIELDATAPLASFRIHAEGLTLERVAVVQRGRDLGARAEPETAGVVTIRLAQPAARGALALEIAFANDFDTRATSLYRLFTGGHWYAFTQFEADDARAAFPCFDEPSFKIPWQVTLTVPQRHLAVSNAPVAREATAADGWRTVEFQRTPPMSSYLVAFATGPLDTVPIPGLAVPGRVVTVRGKTGLAGEAIAMTPPILAALERYFARPYPYAKLDLIAVPEFWYGAMENAGAITFADRILLLDPATASVRQRARLAEVIAHELAHMWFGDLVTMEWWDDLWLNEAFASWLGTRVVDELYPAFESGLASLAGRRNAMNTDARLTTRAVRQPVHATDNLLQLADELAYDKGQAVLTMIERWIGPAAFQRGMAAYVEEFAWRNAAGADLWETLSRVSGENVSRVLPTFLDQPGIPMVSVERLDGGRLRLRQERFLNAGLADTTARRWRIPVTIRYGEGAVVRTHSVLLGKEEQVVRLEAGARAEWIHPNADEAGYYRFRLPPADLEALVSRARRVLTPRERIGLVDNLAALLDAGAIGGDEWLARLGPLADDPEPKVVGAVLDGLSRAADVFVDADLEEEFAAYLRRTLRPALERFGPLPRPGEPAAVAPLRVRLLDRLAGHGRDPELRARLAEWNRAYLADPAAVPADLHDAVVPGAALAGDSALFAEYVRRFESAAAPDDRRRFLGALGRFEDPALLERALDYARTGPLQPQELPVIPGVAASSDARRAVIQRYWMEHFEAMTARLPPMFRGFLPRIAEGCSRERLAEARRFFADPAHQGPGWERELAQVAERVEHCAALRAREGAAVRRFLDAAPSAP